MFTGTPFVRFSQTQRPMANGMMPAVGWLFIVPGLLLTLMALAILLWPELLAYMVAGAMLFGGLSLITWGWSLRRLHRTKRDQSTVVHYDVY